MLRGVFRAILRCRSGRPRGEVMLDPWCWGLHVAWRATFCTLLGKGGASHGLEQHRRFSSVAEPGPSHEGFEKVGQGSADESIEVPSRDARLAERDQPESAAAISSQARALAVCTRGFLIEFHHGKGLPVEWRQNRPCSQVASDTGTRLRGAGSRGSVTTFSRGRAAPACASL